MSTRTLRAALRAALQQSVAVPAVTFGLFTPPVVQREGRVFMNAVEILPDRRGRYEVRGNLFDGSDTVVRYDTKALSENERAKLAALRATRPDDELFSIFWVNGEPTEIVWASDLSEHSDTLWGGVTGE